jgi:hypothetical protein
MHKRSLFFLGLGVLISSTLSFFLLTRGHVWPDDFAGYLLQARSLLAGNMGDFILHNNFTIQNSSYPPGPVAYPWGFPLLLAPVYALFGLNPLWLKLVEIIFYAVFLVSFFFLAQTRLPQSEALLLGGVFSVLPAMLAANDLIQSDIPFLACSTLSLVLMQKLPRGKIGWGLASGVSIFMSFSLRTNGILLLAPLLICLWQAFGADWQHMWKKAVTPLLVFGGMLLIQAILLPGGQETYFSHFSMFTLPRLWENVQYYAWLPGLVFERLPGWNVLYFILLVFLAIGLSQHARRDAFLYIYGLLTLLLFIVWPEHQGLRFVYPLLPVLFIGALDGMLLTIGWLKAGWQKNALFIVRGYWGLILVAGLFVSASSAYNNMAHARDINGPFDLYSKQMYNFIREQTPAKSIIIFMRPRALRLFTDRDAFMTENCEDLDKGDYVALHEKVGDIGQISPDLVTTCNPSVRLEEVFNNKRFSIYKILK